jgi:hypothetical protein
MACIHGFMIAMGRIIDSGSDSTESCHDHGMGTEPETMLPLWIFSDTIKRRSQLARRKGGGKTQSRGNHYDTTAEILKQITLLLVLLFDSFFD